MIGLATEGSGHKRTGWGQKDRVRGRTEQQNLGVGEVMLGRKVGIMCMFWGLNRSIWVTGTQVTESHVFGLHLSKVSDAGGKEGRLSRA